MQFTMIPEAIADETTLKERLLQALTPEASPHKKQKTTAVVAATEDEEDMEEQQQLEEEEEEEERKEENKNCGEFEFDEEGEEQDEKQQMGSDCTAEEVSGLRQQLAAAQGVCAQLTKHYPAMLTGTAENEQRFLHFWATP